MDAAEFLKLLEKAETVEIDPGNAGCLNIFDVEKRRELECLKNLTESDIDELAERIQAGLPVILSELLPDQDGKQIAQELKKRIEQVDIRVQWKERLTNALAPFLE